MSRGRRAQHGAVSHNPDLPVIHDEQPTAAVAGAGDIHRYRRCRPETARAVASCAQESERRAEANTPRHTKKPSLPESRPPSRPRRR